MNAREGISSHLGVYLVGQVLLNSECSHHLWHPPTPESPLCSTLCVRHATPVLSTAFYALHCAQLAHLAHLAHMAHLPRLTHLAPFSLFHCTHQNCIAQNGFY